MHSSPSARSSPLLNALSPGSIEVSALNITMSSPQPTNLPTYQPDTQGRAWSTRQWARGTATPRPGKSPEKLPGDAGALCSFLCIWPHLIFFFKNFISQLLNICIIIIVKLLLYSPLLLYVFSFFSSYCASFKASSWSSCSVAKTSGGRSSIATEFAVERREARADAYFKCGKCVPNVSIFVCFQMLSVSFVEEFTHHIPC